MLVQLFLLPLLAILSITLTIFFQISEAGITISQITKLKRGWAYAKC